MPTYYCSDPHAFHGNILKYCRRIEFMSDADRAASSPWRPGGAT